MSPVDLTLLESDTPSVWAEQSTCEKFSTLSVALCAGSTNYPELFLSFTETADFGQIASDLALWIGEGIMNSDSLDEWRSFLAGVRRDLLTDVWNVYDPQGLIPVADRESVGDLLLGASVFWEFASEVGLTDDENGPQWSSLWFGMIVDPVVRRHMGMSPNGISVQSPLGENEKFSETETW
jgi:hypothetical protein